MSRKYDRDRYGRRYAEEERDYDRYLERGRHDRERDYRSRDYGRTSRESRGRDYGMENEHNAYGYGQDTRYGLDYDRELWTTGTPFRRGYDYGRGYQGDYEDLAGEHISGRGYGRESESIETRRGESGRTPGWGRSQRSYYDDRDYYDRDEGRGAGSAGEALYRRAARGYGQVGDRDTDYDRRERGREREDRSWWERAADEVRSWFGDEESERRRSMDEARGEHRGRGPRGYRRSDERIKEDINDRLTDYPYLDASDIDVSVENGEVTLTGVVDSRQAKRMAEDIAEEVSGVSNVENRLRVRQSRWNTALAAQETTTSITDTTQPDMGTDAAAKTTGAGSSGRRSS